MAAQHIEDKPDVFDGASLHSYMDTYRQEYYHPSALTYDIALDGPVFKGNFTSKSIIYGDTDSTYFVVPAKDKEEAAEMSDFIAERVNKSYPKFMKHAFLCQPGFDKMIACGREIVGANSIFVNKKLYTIHVVDNEGEAVDKIKTMGLAIKKTTLPKPIATKLTSFVKRLLIDEDWSTISRDVVDYKNELKNLDNLLEMGLPKGVNGVEDYYKKYLDDSGTNLPGHVSAAIFYNMNLKEYEDYDNAPISSGNKIKVYYLKKPMGRFKAIALPTDLENIPEWVVENFINKLDIDLQISKLVDDPFESILNAIDYKVPTAQLLLMEDAFEWD
jgi:DNA polymerase elongation subunit (family B)